MTRSGGVVLSALAVGLFTGCTGGPGPQGSPASAPAPLAPALSKYHVFLSRVGTPGHWPVRPSASAAPGNGGGGAGAVSVAMPQVTSAGGPTLNMPRITAITFANDAHSSAVKLGEPSIELIDSFVQFIAVEGAFWSPTAEYGPASGSAGSAVQLAEEAPGIVDDTGVSLDPATGKLVPSIQSWLTAKLDGTHPEFGTPDPNTVYAIFYPLSTRVTFDEGAAAGCEVFGAYHSNITLPPSAEFPQGTSVAYAVIPRCTDASAPNGSMDELTVAASHEFAEAATDPYPMTNPAFDSTDADHLAFALFGGEVGDMCEFQHPNVYVLGNSNFLVQRSWSNQAALAGNDPCVPDVEGLPYFNSAPLANDQLVLVPGQLTTLGSNVPVGSSKTVPVELFSNQPTDPWSVRVLDYASLFGAPAELQFCLSSSPSGAMPGDAACAQALSGKAGDPLYLTIVPKTKGAMLGLPGLSAYAVISRLNDQEHFWFDVVQN